MAPLFAMMFFAAASAHGAGLSLCRDVAEVRATAATCHANSGFVSAARACGEALDAQIALQKASLAVLMGQNNGHSAMAQDAKLANHISNLDQSISTVDELLQKGLAAAETMRSYTLTFTMPGGLSPERFSALGLDSMLDAFPCFNENKNALHAERAAMDDRIRELARTKETLQKLQGRSAGFEGNLKQADSAVSLVKGVGAGPTPEPARVPSGQSTNPASDITGTERAHDDDELLKSFGGKLPVPR